MPANLAALLDTLLVIAGLVLVVTGLVMFIHSKTATGASSVEAFGIKLNVTHPSLILVLAGVGLMLAPRLLPEAARAPEPVVADAEKPKPAEASASAVPAPAPPPAPAAEPATPAVTAAPATTTAPATPAPPAVASKKPPMPPAASAARAPTTPAAKPVVRTNAAPRKPAAQVAVAEPATRPPPEAPAAAAAARALPPSPPPALDPPRPTLAYAALGLPVARSFWSGETRESYTRRMQAALQQAGRDVLRVDVRGLDLGQREFDAWWNESGQYPRSRELCAAAPAPHALLAARVETPVTISSVESAYWPELRLRLFVCSSQRMYRQQKTLAPQGDDAWPFSVELGGEIERFLRAHPLD